MPKLTDPVAFTIFGLEIRWYALFILAGIGVCIVVLQWLARQRGLDPEFVLDIAPWLVISALVGARLYYILLRWPYFADNPGEAINVRLGGLTVHGAIAGGALALCVCCRWRRERVLTWGDLILAVVAIGQAIGRWGNWANQEAFGRPTDLPWAVTIDPDRRPIAYAEFSTFHPTFLYESILDLMLAVILIGVVLRMPDHRFWREGDVIWLYCIAYGSIRLAIESLRTDSLRIGPQPAAYWVSGGLIGFGVAMFIIRRTVWPGMRVTELEPGATDSLAIDAAGPRVRSAGS